MKVFILFLIFTITTALSWSDPINSADEENIGVYIFLHESCRISQFYTLTLKDLHQEYSGNGIVFKGIFPNPDTKEEELDSFKEKYDLSFDMVIDHNHVLTRKLGATITPEVIVFNEKKEEIMYRGRIDDSYFRVGRRKQVTTTSELKDVLKAINNDDPVKVEFKEAIGCFIRKI